MVTEKMDGENCTMYRDGLHARSTDGRDHPSRSWVKRLHAGIRFGIPKGWRVCGENLYARHSIAYDGLPSYFLVFGIYDESNRLLDWERTVTLSRTLGLRCVPLLYRGPYDLERIQDCYTGRSRFGHSMQEGYVLRPAGSILWEDHETSLLKFVREGHVQTDGKWMHRRVVPNGLRESC